jgi:hypothetical protein
MYGGWLGIGQDIHRKILICLVIRVMKFKICIGEYFTCIELGFHKTSACKVLALKTTLAPWENNFTMCFKNDSKNFVL